LNWNAWIRQTHRWLSIAFTAGFIVNGAAWVLAKPPLWLGLFVLVPLLLLLVSGLYLFVLPYALKWRGRRAAVQAKAA
jgi:hypothetical protein